MILIGYKINVFACWLKLKQATMVCHHQLESGNHHMISLCFVCIIFVRSFVCFWLVFGCFYFYFYFYSLLILISIFSTFFVHTVFDSFLTTMVYRLHLKTLKFCLRKQNEKKKITTNSARSKLLTFHLIISVYFLLLVFCSSFGCVWIMADMWENVPSKYQLINIWMKHWVWQTERGAGKEKNRFQAILICLWCCWC